MNIIETQLLHLVYTKNYQNILIKSSHHLSMLLLDKTFVVTVAGDCFGAPENIRFSYATSDEVILKMIDRIKPIFDSIK